jgi:hypothetical protein
MGVAMWLVERPMRPHGHESVVDTLRDGIYWAVVTMTTVGYGDKTPKTTAGRVIAVVWMLASVALVSILSTSIVSRMTAERVVGGLRLTEADLAGKRLAAVAHSSGAEYLDERHLRYAAFDDLAAALTALGRGDVDAVVNSIGALQYLVSTRFKNTIRPPQAFSNQPTLRSRSRPAARSRNRLMRLWSGSQQARSGARSRMATSARSNSHSRTRPRRFAFGWSRFGSFWAAGGVLGPVDPFGFSWLLAVSLRRPPLMSLGLSWISLDSLVRIETFQWVTQLEAGKLFFSRFFRGVEGRRNGSLRSRPCGSPGLFMGQAYPNFRFSAIQKQARVGSRRYVRFR